MRTVCPPWILPSACGLGIQDSYGLGLASRVKNRGFGSWVLGLGG